jgi:cholesterol transport system auxiliary component
MVVGRRWLAGAIALTVAGCSSLFVSTPPPKLYRLTAPHDFPAGQPKVGAQLLIELPQAVAGIDTSRIALSRSPYSIDYFADAEWTERAPDMIADLLLQSFENSGAVQAVGRTAGGLRADFALRTEVRHFEAVYQTPNGPPRVQVEVIVRLLSVPRRAIVAESRFEESVPATANDVPAIVAAFDAATDRALREIVVWTVRNLALSHPRRQIM